MKQYDAWMERKKLVKRTIDIDMRCKNTESPMEPDWYQDTERVGEEGLCGACGSGQADRE